MQGPHLLSEAQCQSMVDAVSAVQTDLCRVYKANYKKMHRDDKLELLEAVRYANALRILLLSLLVQTPEETARRLLSELEESEKGEA